MPAPQPSAGLSIHKYPPVANAMIAALMAAMGPPIGPASTSNTIWPPTVAPPFIWIGIRSAMAVETPKRIPTVTPSVVALDPGSRAAARRTGPYAITAPAKTATLSRNSTIVICQKRSMAASSLKCRLERHGEPALDWNTCRFKDPLLYQLLADQG